ncbi:isopropylmalate isomerase small subunit [Fictibacillus macauensis ZFHKF-1]|uniref:3-isopropylmalate dehydratase small subunit n=1 Tax=Fictibacillus macauensis ZFHKF-1 TaxID=1196324 RepID=I8AI03_9BACL|nr:3-isopropylmalate dehydratase small subunit [Fictibacillus macauensis]EIT85367.1 isopropylmalate isomerase small subunit [Fictibacillus macauensis ZFHKF-1]
MTAFKTFTGVAAVLDRKHVDTDQIIPKQFLKRVERTGFGRYAFFDWRYDSEGHANASFELNAPEVTDADILITGENFGCGSSREHAPWALADYGFKVIIAPSFADIFYNNSLKNGLLLITVSEQERDVLMVKAKKGEKLTVSLDSQTLTFSDGTAFAFSFDPYWKEMLVNGWDEISLTMHYEKNITQHELTHTV